MMDRDLILPELREAIGVAPLRPVLRGGFVPSNEGGKRRSVAAFLQANPDWPRLSVARLRARLAGTEVYRGATVLRLPSWLEGGR